MPDLLTPKVDPSDLVQDTSARVVEKMSRFRGDCPAEFWAWLNAVIRSEADRLIKQYSTAKRTVAREQSLDELADLSDRHRPSETSVEEEDLRQFRISVYQRLKPDLQETIRLRLFENLSFRDMAIRLNREKDSVKKLYYRAIAVWKLACDRELAGTVQRPAIPGASSTSSAPPSRAPVFLSWNLTLVIRDPLPGSVRMFMLTMAGPPGWLI